MDQAGNKKGNLDNYLEIDEQTEVNTVTEDCVTKLTESELFKSMKAYAFSQNLKEDT